MKSAIVPAQITTVEDKVAGNLSLSQLLLLATPVFGGSAIYIILPPSLESSLYKMILISIIAVVFSALAIRIKGRILLLWIITIARYNSRPRYFVFDKNSAYLREESYTDPDGEASKESHPTAQVAEKPHPILTTGESVMLEDILSNPNSNLYFKADRKGGLSVRITEVK